MILLKLKIELSNATMAANVANTYMNLVASFVNSPEFDMAQRNTRFIKEQYDFYAAGLSKAEDALRSFQEKHGIISARQPDRCHCRPGRAN